MKVMENSGKCLKQPLILCRIIFESQMFDRPTNKINKIYITKLESTCNICIIYSNGIGANTDLSGLFDIIEYFI